MELSKFKWKTMKRQWSTITRVYSPWRCSLRMRTTSLVIKIQQSSTLKRLKCQFVWTFASVIWSWSRIISSSSMLHKFWKKMMRTRKLSIEEVVPTWCLVKWIKRRLTLLWLMNLEEVKTRKWLRLFMSSKKRKDFTNKENSSLVRTCSSLDLKVAKAKKAPKRKTKNNWKHLTISNYSPILRNKGSQAIYHLMKKSLQPDLRT